PPLAHHVQGLGDGAIPVRQARQLHARSLAKVSRLTRLTRRGRVDPVSLFKRLTRGGVMTRLNVDGARCEALFASELQRSDVPTAKSGTEAISRTARRLGTRGCAGRMAQEFGDHPRRPP